MTIAGERPAVHETPLGRARLRSVVSARGRIQYIEVSAGDRPASLTVRMADATGTLDCVFMGRRFIAGLEPGVTLCVEGRVAEGDDVPVIFNPRYELCEAQA